MISRHAGKLSAARDGRLGQPIYRIEVAQQTQLRLFHYRYPAHIAGLQLHQSHRILARLFNHLELLDSLFVS
jgi:hypothetical protein